MKKKLIEEPDFIGGLGSLTKEEAAALSAYFAQKKAAVKTQIKQPVNKLIKTTAKRVKAPAKAHS